VSAERWLVTPRRFGLALGGGAALLVVALALGLWIGEEPVDVWGGLTGTGTRLDRDVIQVSRLPRVLAAASVGSLLGLSGACFQGVLRNPLADPYVLGTAGGAAYGSVLAASLGIAGGAWGGRFVCSLAGAFGALGLVLAVARRRGGVSVATLILVGVVVNAFFGAALLFTVALLDPVQTRTAVLWMMGTLGTWNDTLEPRVGAVALAVALVLAMPWARAANALAGGEESAAALGVEVGRARWWLLGAGGLCAGAAVGLAGPIGFVGLIVPHCVRRITGADHRLLFPLSALGGGALLVLADVPARTVVAPQILPVGVFTAMLGAPFFLWLLRRSEAGLWARA
jgi:iron complex transport system permease protein